MPLVADMPTPVGPGLERFTTYLGTAVMYVEGVGRDAMTAGRTVRLDESNFDRVLQRVLEQDVGAAIGQRLDEDTARAFLMMWIGTTWRFEKMRGDKYDYKKEMVFEGRAGGSGVAGESVRDGR
jgi:hypothetical protein